MAAELRQRWAQARTCDGSPDRSRRMRAGGRPRQTPVNGAAAACLRRAQSSPACMSAWAARLRKSGCRGTLQIPRRVLEGAKASSSSSPRAIGPPGPLSQWRAPSPRTTARIPVRPPSIGRPRRRCWLSISSLPSHPSSSKPSCTAAVPPAQRRLFAPYQNPPARPPAPFPSAARPAALFVLLSLRSRAVIPELFRFLPLSELAPRAAAERSSVLRAAAARPQLACLPTHRVGHAAHHPRCTSNRPFSSLHSLAICARQL